MNPFFPAFRLHPCGSSSSTRWQNVNSHHPWTACLIVSKRSKLETPRDYGQCDMRRANLWLKPSPNKESPEIPASVRLVSDSRLWKAETVEWIPKTTWGSCMREEGGVCLQEITGCYFPMPGVILNHGRWLGGGRMARSQGKTKQLPEQSRSW